MSGRRLEVFCFDERAGELVDEIDGLTFAYDEAWRGRDRPPLSQSLTLDGAFARGAPAAYFGGLLPEGEPRELLARRLGISADNDFELLQALGGDTAGAISLLEPGLSPTAGGDVEWLGEAQLGQLVEELPSRPMHADEDGEYRLSLAGVQDKLPVLLGEDGRVGLTKGGTPFDAHPQDADRAVGGHRRQRGGVPGDRPTPRRGGRACAAASRRRPRVPAGGAL